MDEVWKRIGAGKTTAVLGQRLSAPPDDLPARLMIVDCRRFPQPMGPLLSVKREAEQYLGEARHPLLDAELDPDRAGLRRRLFGDVADPERGGALVQVLNRLHARVGRLVLVFIAVDEADDATLRMLQRIVQRKDWLRPALLLCFSERPSDGPASELLKAVRHGEGGDAVIALPEPASAPEAGAPAKFASLPDVDPVTLLELRAAATASEGGRFDAALVASLIERPLTEILYALQAAIDVGVELQDLGGGQFAMPQALTDALRSSVTPSLRVFWHARLARLLGAQPPSHTGPEPRPVASPGEASLHREIGARPTSAFSEVPVGTTAARRPAQDGALRQVLDIPRREFEADRTRTAGEPEDAPWARATRAPLADNEASLRTRGVLESPAGPHESRAGEHHEAAGEPELAATQYLEAARKAAAAGAPEHALELTRLAMAALDKVPAGPRGRRLAAKAWYEAGAIQWRAVGPGEGFTLRSALDSLERARELLTPQPADARSDVALDAQSVELSARVSAALGGVLYDMGDGASLERALVELSSASKRLLDAGLSRQAARLLNDEAAVWVRLGDPVRANYLLQKSREIFRDLVPDEGARLELAETEHLLGRLVLHVPARPEREEQAFRLGHEYCLSAAEVFRELGRARELARVLDTLGRLERRAGHGQQASEHLTQAVQIQQRVGDALGLASSTAALAELLTDAGEFERALDALSTSIMLNRDKGSVRGLRYNGETLDALEKAISPAVRERLSARLGDVRVSVRQAEHVLERRTV